PAQKSILRSIWQCCAVGKPRPVTMACVGTTCVGVARVNVGPVPRICRRGRMCADRYAGCRYQTYREKADGFPHRFARHGQTPLKTWFNGRYYASVDPQIYRLMPVVECVSGSKKPPAGYPFSTEGHVDGSAKVLGWAPEKAHVERYCGEGGIRTRQKFNG